ncbi:MAG: hypothetical protein AAF449_07470, partial [Myxococcota bacterium]
GIDRLHRAIAPYGKAATATVTTCTRLFAQWEFREQCGAALLAPHARGAAGRRAVARSAWALFGHWVSARFLTSSNH